jgi:hypothetical protein
MQIIRTAKALTLATMLGFAALATPPALAADGDGMQTMNREFRSMATSDGMLSKKDFLAVMEKKFDAMDTAKKGMLSVDDVMRIFSDKTGR